MNILLTPQAESESKQVLNNGGVSLRELVSIFEKVDRKNPLSNNQVRKLENTAGDMYVLRVKGVRAIFTRNEKDLVILSIIKG